MLPARMKAHRAGEKANEDEEAADEFKYPLKTHEGRRPAT